MQEERHDGRGCQVGGVHIAEPELHPVGHACFPRVGSRALDEHRVDLDAHAARPELPGGRDRNASVAGSEIVDHVAWPDGGHLEHRANDRHRRRLVAHVAAGNGAAADCRDQRKGSGEPESGGGLHHLILDRTPNRRTNHPVLACRGRRGRFTPP